MLIFCVNEFEIMKKQNYNIYNHNTKKYIFENDKSQKECVRWLEEKYDFKELTNKWYSRFNQKYY